MITTERLTDAFRAGDFDVLVAASPTNVFYLSGLHSLTQHLLGERAFAIRTPHDDGPTLVMPAIDTSILVDTDVEYDRLYTYGSFYLYEGERADAEGRTVLDLVETNNHDDVIEALLSALEPIVDETGSVAIEREGLEPGDFERIESSIDAGAVGPADGILGDLRRVKSPAEIARLRDAVSINEASIDAAVESVEPGITERELSNRYHEQLCRRGATPLFTVVGFGAHGAYPHAVPGDRELEAGDLIRFDVGCRYEHYASDIARTFAFESVDPQTAERYRVLAASMDRTIELLAGGGDTAAAFDGTLEYIAESGAFEEFDRNHVGHGIGIEVYDPPTITAEPARVEPGMVMCVEPPYYEIGTGGLQVEDEVVVTDDGAERLSRCPAEIRVLG